MASATRLKRVMKTIKENPKHWNQNDWHCGTSHCFAGFAVLDKYKQSPKCSAKTINSITTVHTEDEAIDYLKLDTNDAIFLFSPGNTLEELERIVSNLVKKVPIYTGIEYKQYDEDEDEYEDGEGDY
jgi:hypothetical protein